MTAAAMSANPLKKAAEDAEYLLDCLAREIVAKLEAHSEVSQVDWQAYERARQAARDARTLVDEHDTDEWFGCSA